VVFSTLPYSNTGLLASRKVLGKEQDGTDMWLMERVSILAATMAYLIETSSPDSPSSII
jgi:hypothetical protein